MTDVGVSDTSGAGLDPSIGEALCREYALGDLVGSRALPGTRNRNYVLETSSGPADDMEVGMEGRKRVPYQMLE